MKAHHAYIGFVDVFGGGVLEPGCSCGGAYNLVDRYCLAQYKDVVDKARAEERSRIAASVRQAANEKLVFPARQTALMVADLIEELGTP